MGPFLFLYSKAKKADKRIREQRVACDNCSGNLGSSWRPTAISAQSNRVGNIGVGSGGSGGALAPSACKNALISRQNFGQFE